MEGLCFRPTPSHLAVSTAPAGLDVRAAHHQPSHVNAAGRTAVETPLRSPASWFALKAPQWRLWPGKGVVGSGSVEEKEAEMKPVQRGNWVAKILLVKSMWGRKEAGTRGVGLAGKEAEGSGGDEQIRERVEEGDRCLGCCEVEEEEEGEKAVFDQGSFSRLLRRVSLAEASLYSRLSFLGLLAYSVPKIKCGNLLSSRGLRFITSSLERRSVTSDFIPGLKPEIVAERPIAESGNDREDRVAVSAAYDIAASAASYLQSQIKSPGSTTEKGGNHLSPKESSFIATTNSVTAVVAAEEEVKDSVAKDLNSSRSSPCEWFICDDDSSKTRYFVIQGSETLASWQANLLFEPIQFEGLDFAVHRGIYEAAKGIYERILPEIRAHLRTHGRSAAFQFTGHSLGGSLSLLLSLMILIRGEAPTSSLLPVVTFGAPSVLCGGNHLLRKLGLPLNHVHSIMMHRDIVPRAFSCSYPNHVAEILKAVNKNFRNHTCLKAKKLLYEPMGELLILQPDSKSSPHHHLLPSGSGLYALANPDVPPRLIHSAQSFFLNSPHPLEILSDRAAYGINGTVSRDHDMTAYVRTVQKIVRIEVKCIRKARVERRRKIWTTLVLVDGTDAVAQRPVSRISAPSRPGSFAAGILRGGMEPLRRFRRLVASQHVNLFVVMFLPAQVMIMKALAVVRLP